MLISLSTVRNLAVCALVCTVGFLAYQASAYACREISEFVCREVAKQFARGAIVLTSGN
jgi:hypothetical protein